MNFKTGWIAVLFLFSGTVYAGPVCTGCGGSFVQPGAGSGPILLDRFSVMGEGDPLPSKSDPGETLSSKIFELAPSRDLSRSTQRALEMLAPWEKDSPALVELLRDTVMRTHSMTGSCFATQPRYVLDPWVTKRYPKVKVTTAILYLRDYGPIISAPRWNGLDLDTQAGLLIHEALRQIQNAYGYGIGDEQIQLVTGRIVQSRPRGGESLERPPYVNEKLAQSLKRYRDWVAQSNAQGIAICSGLRENIEAQSRPWVPTSEDCAFLVPLLRSRDIALQGILYNWEIQLRQEHRDFSLDRLKRIRSEACDAPAKVPFSDLQWQTDRDIELTRCMVSESLSPEVRESCGRIRSIGLSGDDSAVDEDTNRVKADLAQATRVEGAKADFGKIWRDLVADHVLKSCD